MEWIYRVAVYVVYYMLLQIPAPNIGYQFPVLLIICIGTGIGPEQNI